MLRWSQEARVVKRLLAFKRPALEWLESIPSSAVDFWDKLRTDLLEWFLPPNIAQILDTEVQILRQGAGECP